MVRRKVPGLVQGLGGGSLAAVAYGEIGSSLYFALGVVALYALGLTPWILLGAGALFVVVALSYAEGTAAIAEPGGAATFVRRAYNDVAGFLTGWVLFLDYLIVIALAALFAPHYVGEALSVEALTARPGDVLCGLAAIVGVAAVRLVRRSALYRLAQVVAATAIVTHVVLIAVGGVYVLSVDALSRGTDPGSAPSWHALLFALPLAMLAFTGLETVANFAAEAREPGRSLPRGLVGGISAVVVVSVALAAVALSAYPARRDAGGWSTDLGDEWLRAPLVGVAAALPSGIAGLMQVVVGISGAVVLLAAVTTSFSGAGRLALALARHDMLPHAFARLSPRSLLPPAAIVGAAVASSALLVIGSVADDEVQFLASLYSFGILIAFTLAQLAVVRLRRREPDLPRPFRAPAMPLVGLFGAAATASVLVIALATHGAPRIAGPIWLALGLALFVWVRGRRSLERVRAPVADLVPSVEGAFDRIVVPLKLGPIGEEVLGTAIRLAEERSARILILHVLVVPLAKPLDAPLPDAEGLARASLAEAKSLAVENGATVETRLVRSRSLAQAVIEQTRSFRGDLIVMGSAPRWRRQSRFFSPTVEHVLRKAPCEVMVVAYPQGILEEISAV